MAKKKKRRRPGSRPTRPVPPAGAGAAPPAKSGVSATAAARRERKEEARQARQAALRRYGRQRNMRRALVWGGAGLAVALVALYLGSQGGASGSGKLSKAGARIAAAAGCTGVESPEDQGRTHLDSGESYTYPQQPPTSGPHDQNPLNAGVYSTPQSETQMVHSLEHGAVEIYYESTGANALSSDVVAALASAAQGNRRAIMTPAPQTLSGPLDDKTFTVSLAFAAWDRLVQCPNTITASQAKALALAWIKGFVNSSTAPEHGLPI